MLVTDARPLHEVLAAALAPAADDALVSPTVAQVVDAFLEYASGHNRPGTVAQYAWYGAKLKAEIGEVRALEVRPIHVTRWVGRLGWRGSHEYNGRRYAFRFLAWAAEEGLLPRNPLEGLVTASVYVHLAGQVSHLQAAAAIAARPARRSA